MEKNTDLQKFFSAVFDDIPEGTNALIWTLGDKKSFWFSEPEAAIEHAAKQQADTYAGVGLAQAGRGNNERCPADELLGAVGLVADIDIAGPAHKKASLPPDDAAAKSLVMGHGCDPTILVNSGHGLQAWWLFKEPWLFDKAEELERAKELSFRLHSWIKSRATDKGWTIDSVFDLARVMRVPGTWNCKNGKKVQARILEFDDSRRWEPSDLDGFLPQAVNPPETSKEVHQNASLILDPKARMSLPDFGQACMIEPRLAPTWEGKRDDLASGSEIDMSLASLLAGCGWEDQAIANAIIHRRREFNDKPEKARRLDYMTNTILKARAGKETEAATQGLDDAILVAGTPYEPEDNKQKLLELISKRLKIKILRVIRYVPEPFVYALETEKGICEIGRVSDLITQAKLQTRLFDVVQHYFPPIKGTKEDKDSGWSAIVRAFAAVEEDVAVTGEHNQEDETNAWLHEFMEDYLQNSSIQDITDLYQPKRVFSFEGATYISFSPFRYWLLMRMGELIDNKTLARRLTAAGCEFGKISYYIHKQRKQAIAWKLCDAQLDGLTC